MKKGTEDWISADPAISGGKPCITGTRIPVELILDKLAAGESYQQILDAHPRLTEDAIKATIAFASENLKTDTIYPIKRAAGE